MVAKVLARERSHVGRFCHRIAHTHTPHALDDRVGEGVGDRFVDDEALGGDAALAAVDEPAGHARFDGSRQIRVFEDDVGVASAELEHA